MELKAIDRTDRNRGLLYAALDIYRESVRPEEQNPETQILHWIDHRKDLLADEFQCFALKRDGTVVGYLQYSYFSEEHIFFLEYLCIRSTAGAGLVPNREIVSALRRHFIENYKPGFTVVFEVAHEKSSGGKRVSDKKRVNYFERLGFRKVDYPYRFPILQTYDGEISYPADLMVLLPERQKIVSSAQLRTILRCLYFKHYLRWDRPFLDPIQFEHRQKLIDDLYALQISQMGNRDTFNTDGDDRRLGFFSFDRYQPKINALFSKVFGPKLPRLLVVVLILMLLQRYFQSVWLLIPFLVAVVIVYCVVEDTDTSVKILSAVMSRISLGPPRQS